MISSLEENCHHVLMQLHTPTDPIVQKLTAAYWTSFCERSIKSNTELDNV